MIPGTVVTKGKLASTGGIQGVPGIQGDKGDTGSQGLIEEAPQDDVVYGRWNTQWVHAVSGTGDVMTGDLIIAQPSVIANASLYLAVNDTKAWNKDSIQIYHAAGNSELWGTARNALGVLTWNEAFLRTGTGVKKAGDTMTGGLHFGSVVAGSATDLSRHIDLWGGTYGFNVTSGTINYVAAAHKFNNGVTVTAGGLNVSGGATFNNAVTIWGALSGVQGGATISNGLVVNGGNPSIKANNGRIVSACSYASVAAWDTANRCTGLIQMGPEAYIANADGNGYYNTDWWFRFNGDYQTTCRRGLRYQYMYYGSTNAFGFGWNIWPGFINGTVDEAAFYPFANGSDARLKDNIKPSSLDCLSIVEQLPLVEYQWRDFPHTVIPHSERLPDPEPDKESSYADPKRLREAKARPDSPLKRIGMIAQEVYKVCPDVILEGDDFEDHLGRVWSIDHNNMQALLVGAIQQLNKDVIALKKKNI